MYFSTLSLTARGFNPSSNSNICMKSCSFILHHTRHLQKMQMLGVALWKIFRNEAPVSIGGGSWNPYQSMPIQHPEDFVSYPSSSRPPDPFAHCCFLAMGGPHWKQLCLVCALLTACVLAVLTLPKLPGTARTPGRSVFIQAAGHPQAKMKTA